MAVCWEKTTAVCLGFYLVVCSVAMKDDGRVVSKVDVRVLSKVERMVY